MAKTLESLAEELRGEALDYPDTYEETPWGDRVVKVKGKVFFFCGVHKDKLNATVKLPQSGAMALQMPFAKPTGYGLGKSGWVTATFEKASAVPVPIILEWLEESFRAVAPKTILKKWEAGGKAKPAAAKPVEKVKNVPVVLVGDDNLRLERAREALEERGFKIASVSAPDENAMHALGRKKPQAIVIDLGRRAPAGLELASALSRSEFKDVPLFFAGARDAAAEKRIAQSLPGAAGCARVPPGDPEFVDLLVKGLSKAKGKKE